MVSQRREHIDIGQRSTSDRIPACLPPMQEEKCPMKIKVELVMSDDNDHEEPPY
jgi:hypothetical protein